MEKSPSKTSKISAQDIQPPKYDQPYHPYINHSISTQNHRVNNSLSYKYSSYMNSPTKTLNSSASTFYNLQNKRTLPREVLKWMQGLDLSYSVKDYRKDMSNGFLIGQIISRYEPGRIPMHSFQNSQNVTRRDNNWNQLHLFFRKQTLRQVHIGSEEYMNIMKGNDPKSEQLYHFVCRLYTICTKRTLPQNAPIIDLPPTQTNNPNLTASYLLKEDGLQKLQNNNSNVLATSGNKSNQIDNSKVEDKSLDRAPTRKIVPNIDPNSNVVDVMGIGIKADNRKMTSKRKSWQVAKEQSNYEQQNGDNQKLIFDYLNEIIQQCIPQNNYTLKQTIFPQNPKYNPTQSIKKMLPDIDPDFFINFLNQINLNINELVPILLRQLNETWKFFSYFLKMFRYFSYDKQQFGLLYEIVKNYAISCYNKQAKRIQKVFLESLISTLVSEVKACKQWKKREKLMFLVYDFEGREISEKKVGLNRLKQIIGSNNPLYIQWLAVLVKEQTSVQNNIGNRLIQDYIYYAHQYIGSSSQILRTSSLKILYQISKTQSIQLIQAYFYSKATAFQSSQADPQQVMLLILIYINLLKNLIDSKEYQSLIKGNNANNLVKVYNPDNQKNLEDLKRKASSLGQTVYRLFNCTSDLTVREICARLALSLMPQNQSMMQIFLEFISIVREKAEFIRAQQNEYQLKSLKIECQKVNTSIIEQYSNQILVQIIGHILKNGASIEGYLYLINHSLKHLNIKKVNMQIWQDISLHIVKPYTELITDYKCCKQAFEGIHNICEIYFNYDMKIRELNGWLSKGIIKIIQQNNNGCRPSVLAFNEFLNNEYAKNRQQTIRFMAEQLSQLLQSKGIHNIISIRQN